MADCGELFRRRQEILERKKAMEDAASDMEARLSVGGRGRLGGDPDDIPENDWVSASNEASDYVNTPEAMEAVQRGLNGEVPVNIGEGQPTNFTRLLQQVDVDTAEGYATLHQLLTRTHQEIDPEGYAFVTQQYGRERVLAMVEKAYEDYGIKGEQLGQLAQDVAPFLRLVDNMARLGAMSNQMKASYLDLVGQVAEAIEQGGAVPTDLRSRLFRAYKVAVVGERHFDLARRRTGQTLRSLQDIPDYTVPARAPGAEGEVPAQGAGIPGGGADIPRQGMPGIRGDQSPLPISMSDELKERLNGRGVYSPDLDDAAEVLGTKPEDVNQGSHVAQVMQAVEEAKGKPKAAARKVRQLKAAGEVAGLSPRDRFASEDDWINHNLKYANILAKDSMLLQLRSHLGLNVPSNVAMGMYGVQRQAFENVGLIPTYGSKITVRSAMEAMEAAYASSRMAMQLTTANARALFMDTLMNNRAFYGNNQDLAVVARPELLKADLNEFEVARMRMAKDLEIPLDSLEHAATKAAGLVLKTNAAFRLFLHDQFGLKGPLLQPGLRTMVATDNVGGYFFYTFKLYNDLMMEARFRAGELGLESPQAQMKWVQDRFEEQFIKLKADATDIAAYRREKGPLVTSNLTDDQVAELISNERAQNFQGFEALTYGVPRPDSELARRADEFSREMRFQRAPQNTVGKTVYGGLQTVRQKWWADTAIPFFQAPFAGGLFDLAVGTDPLIGGLRLFMWNRMDKRARARALASWMTGNMIAGLFLLADMADGDEDHLVIGSGRHLTDPREREEWEAALRAKGRAPNTVAGIPVSGIPILNTLMLWRDMKDAGTYAGLSKLDQARWWEAQMGVITGHLMRMTGVQQIQRIVQILTSTGDRMAEQVGNFAGFQIGSYAIPGIGLVRQGGALLQANNAQMYRNRGPTAEEQAVGIDWEIHKRLEEMVRNTAYGAVPFTQLLPGGIRKQKDHLGQPLRLPWGLPVAQWLQDRFSPQAWPKGVENTYAQLDLHNLLRTPEPLFKRELKGVRMNDQLLEEYRTALSETKGSRSMLAEMSFLGMPTEISFSGQVTQEAMGLRRRKSYQLAKVPIHSMLRRHIVGNTRLEAFTSLFSDPAYQALMANPTTTADPTVEDQTRAAARRSVAGRIVRAVDAYYQAQATASIERSQSPAAMDWKRRRDLVEAQKTIRRGIEQLKGTVEIINGPAE